MPATATELAAVARADRRRGRSADARDARLRAARARAAGRGRDRAARAAAPRRGARRVAAAGVCHSDVRLADGALGDGRWPIVLGHEGAGVIESVGEDVSGLAPGDHVAFCFVPPCGACGACRAATRRCASRRAQAPSPGRCSTGPRACALLDGTTLQHGLLVACFAEYAVLPAAAPCRSRASSRCGRPRCSAVASSPGSAPSTPPA